MEIKPNFYLLHTTLRPYIAKQQVSLYPHCTGAYVYFTQV